MAQRGGRGLTVAPTEGSIFLLHVPKTGGQTLARRLAVGFAPERRNVLQRDVFNPTQLAEFAAAYDFFEAHPACGVLASPPAGLRVMTVVRDPVEQAISHYRHVMRDPQQAFHKLAAAMPMTAFFERFAHFMFNFQTRTVVAAWYEQLPRDYIRGETLWLARHLDEATSGLEWLVPAEEIDSFCLLWVMAERRAVSAVQGWDNVAPHDTVDAPALRAWLRARPERYALDSLLWDLAQSRFAAWRRRVLTAPELPNSPSLAWSEGESAIWLTDDWHDPIRREDGIVEWWSGPDEFSRFRVRRNRRQARLYFEGVSFLGVRWQRVRLLRTDTGQEMEIGRELPEGSSIARYTADLTDLPLDVELLLYAKEHVGVLPAIPVALTRPRRGYATQNWRLE